MNVPKYIWIKGKRYYYYDTYTNKEQMNHVIRSKKRICRKNKHFVIKHDTSGIIGFISPHTTYSLYMTKIIRIGMI